MKTICAIGIVLVGTLIAFATPVAAQSPDPAVAAGIAWLQGQVQSNGSLASEAQSIATPMQVRSEAAVTLAALSTAPSALIQSVNSITDPLTEYDARRAWVAAASQTAANVSATDLLAFQNGDGGFGGAAGYTSNPLDTSFALLALYNFGSVDSAKISGALQYLRTSKHADGGWGADDQSSVYVTSYALLGAQRWSARLGDTDVANAARDWLLAHRNGAQQYNGQFDNIVALFALPAITADDAVLTPLKQAVNAGQGGDGSWNADGYLTALAVRALQSGSQSPVQSAVRGHVIDGQTRQSLSGASVTLVGPQSYAQSTNANGNFVFPNVVAGNYTLHVADTGFNTVSATTSSRAGQALDVGTIALLPTGNSLTGTVTGTVTDIGTQAPIAGAAVSVNGFNVVTATDGTFEISNMAAGSVTASASALGYQTLTSSGSLPAGGILQFTFQLLGGSAAGSGTATLQGRIIAANTAQPVANATIAVTGSTTVSTQSDASGSYQLSGLPPSNVQINVTASGYDSVAAATQLHGNSTTTFSPKLYPTGTSPPDANTAGVSGTVVDSTTGQPLANVAVVATTPAPNGTTKNATTDANGHFAVTGLNREQVALSFTLGGYVAAQLSALLDPLQVRDIGQIRLRPNSVSQLLPDLVVVSVDSKTQASTDPQTLVLSGTAQVTFKNIGTAPTTAGFNVVAFYDINQNGAYDNGVDTILGSARITQPMAVGQSVTVPISVSGTLPFRDAPVSVVADSGAEILEVNKANNVGTSASLCGIAPHSGGAAFTPVLKWAWSSSSILPQYNQVMMAPVVARTHDDNGDGKIDQNDTPDVIFVAYGGRGDDYGDGILRIISGKDGSDLVAVTDPNYRLTSYANLAVGDIDGDGNVEIVGPRQGGGLVAFAHDGTPLWSVSYPVPDRWDFGAPAIVDLDGDGHPVIILGGHVVSATGQLLWSASSGYHGGTHRDGSGGIAVDLNNDGHMAVLFGASAFAADGTLLWQNTTVGDGIDAVGRFNPHDPYPEIVVVSISQVSLLDHNGNLIWGPVALPGGGNGGAPIVADLDGDGIPEIGVAGLTNYVVFNPDGSVRWTSATQEDGSSCTSSTVFDFYNDGQKEIVYSDNLNLRAYNGSDGTILWQIQNTSGTAYELPVLADIDNSGQASLLVVSNNYYGNFPGVTNGVRAFTDPNGAWADTRQIWNQLSYHIDNINDDGSIPHHEKPSWLTHNTYRLNEKLNPFGRADLTAGVLQVIDTGTGQPLTLRARIGNGGQVASGSTTAAFYSGNPASGGTLVGSVPVDAIDPGVYRDVQLPNVTGLSGTQDIYVVVDPANLVQECDKSNNIDHTPYAANNVLAHLSVGTDAASYSANSSVQLSATITNTGSFAASLSVDRRIEDTSGNIVVDFGSEALGIVNAGAIANVPQTWNTGTTLAGPYVVHGLLHAADGSLVAEATSMFTISAQVGTTAALSVATTQQVYGTTQSPNITYTAVNTNSNAVLADARVHLQVKDAGSNIVFDHDFDVGLLVPNGIRSGNTQGLSTPLPVGTYAATGTLRDGQNGTLFATGTASFVVTTQVAGLLKGAATVSATQVIIDQNVICNVSVTDRGPDAIAGQPVRFGIRGLTTGILNSENDASIDLTANNSWTGSVTVAANTLGTGQQSCALEAQIGGAWVAIANANFAVYYSTDLQTRITSRSSELVPGQLQFYHVQVTNAGPDTSVGATLSISLPLQIGWLGANSPNLGCSVDSAQVRCPLPALTSGQALDICVATRVHHASAMAVSTQATSTIDTATTLDMYADNNSATVTTNIVPDYLYANGFEPQPCGLYVSDIIFIDGLE